MGIVESGTLATSLKSALGIIPALEAKVILLSLVLSNLNGVVYKFALPFLRKTSPLISKSTTSSLFSSLRVLLNCKKSFPGNQFLDKQKPH